MSENDKESELKRLEALLEKNMSQIKSKIIVLSNKGGVGKSAVAVNIAVCLSKLGKKVGLLKIRVFRPFPTEEIIKVLSAAKAVAVLDRSDSFGAFGGPVYSEIRSAMYDVDKNIPITNYIYGLGGRDIGPKLITKVVNDLEEIIKTDKVKEHITYLGVRE